ncbi:nSTAND3 domain-containing NTPase [Pedobacter jejuensis]|nr:ATP-binding protein [Pedobacter jejuensis]
MKEYVLKITNPEGPGSAFITYPDEESDYAYIITARHCLVHTNGTPFEKHELQVGFLNNGIWANYKLKDNDQIYVGKDNETEDIGLIIVEKKNVPLHLDDKEIPKLCVPPKEGNLVITGFPKVTNNALKRSLFKVKFLDEQDYPCQVQVESDDPLTKEYNADNLVEGYSGSPLIIKSKEVEFICGIFLRYEEKTKRILGIDLSLLNSFLLASSLIPLELNVIEINSSVIEGLARLKINTDRILRRVRENIGEVELDRKNLYDEVSKLIKSSKLVIISGKPGSGKSAIAKKVIIDLRGKYRLIALQGEQLDKPSIEDIFALSPFLLNDPLQTLLDSPAFSGNKIVFIDSIEKILETENADTILDFFDLLKMRSDISLVLTCRSYAIEQLKIRFLRQFPSFPNFEIDVLEEKELEVVALKYPHIKPLLSNLALLDILKIPFNLDKAVLIPEAAIKEGIGSEKEFSRIMWEYVVEGKDKVVDAEKRKLRGNLFSKIAIERASAMVAYVYIPDCSMDILNGLVADHLVDKEPTLGLTYSVTHDIYEDWALIRYIEIHYQEIIVKHGQYIKFYNQLGSAPAVRRAFRLWFSEKIQVMDLALSDFLKCSIQEKSIAKYWQDELLVAIMQSPYSKSFLSDNKAFLFANNYEIFKRVAFILRVACQQPDFRYIDIFPAEEKIKLYYDINLLPIGDGWANTIIFISENLDELKNCFVHITEVVLQWKKGLSEIGTLPAEARSAGLIVLSYFEEYKNEESEVAKRSERKDYMEEFILLLFRLTEVIREELKALISTAFKYERKAENYALSNLYDKLIEFTVDGYEDTYVCKYYPELVIEILEAKWFYYPPTPEELEKRKNDPRFWAYESGGIDKEQDFGLKKNTNHKYFPATPEQTPILNLLYAKPVLTLKFLLKFLNHVADAFVKSDYALNNPFFGGQEERCKIQIKFNDGSIYQQYGSVTLWTAFRGTYIAIPNLLQSVLMALEAFMLSLGETIEKSKDEKYKEYSQKIWNLFFDKLLKESNNVMGSSVLLSVAHAYRNIAGEKIIPLLYAKQIYFWDFMRTNKDRGTLLSPLSSKRNGRQKQKALAEFQRLPHRKRDIRELVINLSFTNKQIFTVLDELYAIEDADAQWKIMVSSMDSRLFELGEVVDGGIMVETKLEGELKEVSEEAKKDVEAHNAVAGVSLWGMKKLQHESVEEDSVDKWRDHYNLTLQTIATSKLSNLKTQPGLLAGIGIRDFFDKLSEEERSWCIGKVWDIIHYQTFEANKERDFMHIEYTPFETEAAFSVLPKIMHISKGREKTELKRYIFTSLIRHDEKSSKDALIASLRTFLWENDQPFVISCVKGVIEYAGIQRLLYIGRNREMIIKTHQESALRKIWKIFTGPFRKPPVEDKIDEAEIKFDNLIKQIGEGQIRIDLTEVSMVGKAAGLLFYVMKIIPENVEVREIRKYYMNLLKFVLEHIDNDEEQGFGVNDRFHYEQIQEFEKEFAAFLLSQPAPIAFEGLKVLTDWVYETASKKRYRDKKYELVEGCLKEMINCVVIDETKAVIFWKLWEYLIDKDIEGGSMALNKYLLLDHYIFSSAARIWEPLVGKKDLYAKFIAAGADIGASAKLIAGIGFNEFVPDGVLWLSNRLTEAKLSEEDMSIYFEQLVIQCYYDSRLRNILKTTVRYREAFINILDELINTGSSSSAYIIRDDFISLKS